MLKYTTAQITFAEVPDEISLTIELSNCPYHCPECHSKHLWDDIGTELTKEELIKLIDNNKGCTCVCFMGGDNDLDELTRLCGYILGRSDYPRRICWYTGADKIPNHALISYLSYIKIGPYKSEFGPLNNPNTNQTFYTRGNLMKKMDANSNMWYDTTDKFWKNEENN